MSGSVRLRLVVSATLTVLVLIGAALFASSALETGRKHLGTIEQVRELETSAERLLRDAQRYRNNAPRDYPDYWRDTELYYRQLRDDLAKIDDALLRVQTSLTAQPAGMADILAGHAARATNTAVRDLLDYWLLFRQRFEERIGPNKGEPRLEWGAIFIADEALHLREHIDAVSTHSERLADVHLDTVLRMGRYGFPIAFLAVLAMLSLAAWSIYRRMLGTLEGSDRIARGEFGLQLVVDRHDEIGALAESINTVSRRVRVVLDAIERMQGARDVNTALQDTREALQSLLPIGWMAAYDVGPDSREAVQLACTPDSSWAPIHLPAIERPQREGLRTLQPGPALAELLQGLEQNGLQDVLLVGVPRAGGRELILVWASRETGALEGDAGDLLLAVAPVIAQGIDQLSLTEHLLLATISGLAALAERRDPETGNHLIRMALYSRIIAEQMAADDLGDALALNARRIAMIYRFAPMHDIGKVGIDDAILRKPGKLSDAEMAAMRMHPLIGGSVLRACQAQLPAQEHHLFEVAIEIAEGHHEKFDGSGYPRGLAGETIPLAARIVAAADVLDALSSKRPYKEAWSLQHSLAYLQSESGRHFDPAVVRAAHAAGDRIALVHAAYGAADETDAPAPTPAPSTSSQQDVTP
jgi:HD-GYP domain-containing protein (c-di-GMP phosphodiesterase class II)